CVQTPRVAAAVAAPRMMNKPRRSDHGCLRDDFLELSQNHATESDLRRICDPLPWPRTFPVRRDWENLVSGSEGLLADTRADQCGQLHKVASFFFIKWRCGQIVERITVPSPPVSSSLHPHVEPLV